ncbi:MAG: DoxX family protein [Bacteroidota bacterium]
MNIALWIVQGLLAAAFLMAGSMKLSKSKEELKNQLGDWVDTFSDSTIKTIGLLEVLGGVGIILPMLIGILPILTPIAGIGLALTMVGAMIVHINRGEYGALKNNVPLLLLALFVIIGRFMIVPVI